MGSALFVTLERPIEGVDPCATNGKAIARSSDELDAAAEELGVTPLSQLFSASPDDVEAMLDGRPAGGRSLPHERGLLT